MKKNIYPLILLGAVVLYEAGQEYDAFPLGGNNVQATLTDAEHSLVRSWSADTEENSHV